MLTAANLVSFLIRAPRTVKHFVHRALFSHFPHSFFVRYCLMDFSICSRPIKTLGRRTNKRLDLKLKTRLIFIFECLTIKKWQILFYIRIFMPNSRQWMHILKSWCNLGSSKVDRGHERWLIKILHLGKQWLLEIEQHQLHWLHWFTRCIIRIQIIEHQTDPIRQSDFIGRWSIDDGPIRSEKTWLRAWTEMGMKNKVQCCLL